MSTPDHKEQALAYARRGWPVFPLHGIGSHGFCACGRRDCGSPGKHPLGRLAPKGVHNATTDLSVIDNWWTQFPEAGIGVATGARSGLVVLDVDAGKGGMDSLHELCRVRGDITQTPRVKTGGGGLHLYYRHPGHEVRNQAGMLGAGLDVRGDGGYVVAPPSRHISGGRYEWIVPFYDDIPLLPCPGVISEARADSQTQGAAEVVAGSVREGERNATLTSFAGTMRRRGAPENVIRAALQEMNDTMFQPPLSKKEVARVAQSVARYEPKEVLHRLSDVEAEIDDAHTTPIEPMADVYRRVLDEMHRHAEAGGGMLGLGTGFAALDELTGGFQRKDLILLAARPSMGKSALANVMARHLAADRPGAIFSLEMSSEAWAQRDLSAASGVSSLDMRLGHLGTGDVQAVRNEAERRLMPLRLWISDEASITLGRMKAALLHMRREGHAPAFAFVDYMQLMQAYDANTREQEVAQVSRGLKQMAKAFDMPVIAVAQLNRDLKHRKDKRPKLTDLRDSGQIEQDSDLVLFLHRPEYYGETHAEIGGQVYPTRGLAELIVAKQRNGPLDTVLLHFDHKLALFSPYDKIQHTNGHTTGHAPF